MDAEDVAELLALYMRNDWMCCDVGQGVKVFVQKRYQFVEIVGWVEKFVGLYTYHCVHILIALTN